MLDPNRPFRDDETVFYPVGIVNGTFPLTDETGLPSGLYFSVNRFFNSDYTLLISTPAASAYGAAATLEVDLDKPFYCNTLALNPFSAYPAYLTSVSVQGLASTQTLLFQGSVLIDKAVNIRFPRQLITKVILTFSMQNYTVVETQDASIDSLRLATMATVEAALPFSLGNYRAPVTTTTRGYEYSLGFGGIQGIDVQPALPGVLVQGPITIPGCPLILRFDAESVSTCDVYLCYQAFNSVGVLVDQNTTGILMAPGTSFVVPYTGGTVLADITSTQVSFKTVLRSASSVLSRFNLQAALL